MNNFNLVFLLVVLTASRQELQETEFWRVTRITLFGVILSVRRQGFLINEPFICILENLWECVASKVFSRHTVFSRHLSVLMKDPGHLQVLWIIVAYRSRYCFNSPSKACSTSLMLNNCDPFSSCTVNAPTPWWRSVLWLISRAIVWRYI